MRLPFENKVAVVTGGGRGIGRATALALAAEGAAVIIVDVNSENASAVAAEIGTQATAIATDVTNSEQVSALFASIKEKWQRLDVLICNAGYPFRLTSSEATEGEWEECLAVNLKSVWLCVRAAVPLLRAAKTGSVVTVASIQGMRSTKRSFPYSVAKGGLLSLTRTLAVELAPTIRVNAVVPGQVESVRTQPFFNSFRDPEKARGRVLSTYPMGRLGRPDDVAHAIIFLASEMASWITGTSLAVDGGFDAALLDLSDWEEP